MESGFDVTGVLKNVLDNLTAAVVDVVPRILTALVVIIVGLIVAKIAERGIRGLFDRFRLNDLLERVGVSENLAKIGLRGSPGRLLSRTVYFLLVVLFTQAVSRAVGLEVIANAIGSFLGYLPNLAAAFLVLLLGMMVAQLVGRSVTASAEESGIDYAPLLGRVVSALVVFVVAIMALSQLRIDTQIIRLVVLVVLAGLALALALSFGLGTRGITRNLVAGFYARRLFTAGEEIEVGGERGVLIGVTPLQTLFEQDGRTVSVPNQVFLDEVAKSGGSR